jgi:hypothetical protein
MTMSAGATTSALRPTEPPVAALTTPAPAAPSTKKKVPTTSAKSRRHSYCMSKKSRAQMGVGGTSGTRAAFAECTSTSSLRVGEPDAPWLCASPPACTHGTVANDGLPGQVEGPARTPRDYDPRVRHADQETFELLADVLAALRGIPELTEKKTGTFYRRSKAFVHFHDDPAGPYADLRTDADGDFERVRVRTATDQRQFLARVRAAVRS